MTRRDLQNGSSEDHALCCTSTILIKKTSKPKSILTTVITPQTVEVLKNFCTINKSIVIKPGNTISTLSINKNILAIAEVEEQFDSQISIYDLGQFLGGIFRSTED